MPRAKSLSGHADVAQFRALLGKSSQVEPALKRSLRKNLRAVATPIVADMQSTVRQAPIRPGVEHAPHTIPLRETLAAGISVSILAGNKAGVVIRSTGKGLQSPRLARAYDKPNGWRHPAWGQDAWVQQIGRPYFGSVAKRHRDDATRAVVRSLNEATATLKGH